MSKLVIITKESTGLPRHSWKEIRLKSDGWKVGQLVKFPAFGPAFRVAAVEPLELSAVRVAVLLNPKFRTELESILAAHAARLLSQETYTALTERGRVPSDNAKTRRQALRLIGDQRGLPV